MMQAKQYEERIMKLQDALEMQKLKNTSQLGRLRMLEEQLEQSQRALEEERNEKELLLKNRSTNRLLLELKEERVQRLQDLEEIYDKDRQVESLTNEVNIMSKGISETQEELLHREAEVTGLRASVRCSTKLLHEAEKNFLQTHQELQETQLKFLDCKRRLTAKEAEVRLWIERYEQVMLDLHVSQFKLTQLARDASEKDAALTRGNCVVLDKTAQGNNVLLKQRSVSSIKDVGESDRLVRKFRQDLIPNRSQSNIASLGQLRHSASNDQLQTTPKKVIGIVDSVGHASRECVHCPANSSSLAKMGPLSRLKPNQRETNPHTRCEESITNQQQPGSKYLGYGLGLLKKDHIVPPANP